MLASSSRAFAAAGRAAAALVALVPFSASGVAQTVAARDTVVLTNGKELRGRVVREDEVEVVLRVGSRDRVLARAEVRAVQSVAQRHRGLLIAWQKTAVTDVAALLELAAAAANSDLPHEARLLRWYAALQRPNDEAIHALLGNRSQGGRFLVEIDGRWVPFAGADALGEDFDDAWRLRSEHFTIQCAAGLRAGLDTLMELEGLYWMFHDTFGKELRLLELVEPLGVRLYRSRAQMPGIGTHVGALFSPAEQALLTCFENGRPFALVHEATHALLHSFFVRAAKSRGTLPAWLDEGWAEYMDGRVETRVPGKPVLRAASVQPAHRALLAAAKQDDLFGVHRLLNFKSSDFQASSQQREKYAQSWALFRYLLEHPDGALRARFLDYLREAAAGKGQASTFRRIFAREERRLEEEPWRS